MTTAQSGQQEQQEQKLTEADWIRLRKDVTFDLDKLEFASFQDKWLHCQHYAQSDYVQDSMRGKPHNVLIAIDYGKAYGLTAVASIQNIVVINKKPSLPVKMMLGLCYKSGKMDVGAFEQHWTGKPFDDDFTAHCTSRRKDGKPVYRTFSVADAKRAGLWNKDNYKHYGQWMLMYRATGASLGTALADVLQGLYCTEELTVDQVMDQIDLGEDDATRAERIERELTAPAPVEPEPLSPVEPPAQPLVPAKPHVEPTYHELSDKPGEPEPEPESKPGKAIGERSGQYKNLKAAFDGLPPIKQSAIRAKFGVITVSDFAKCDHERAVIVKQAIDEAAAGK